METHGAQPLGHRSLLESFGGSESTTAEAVEDAFKKSCLLSVHVLLATVVGPEHGGLKRLLK